MTRELAFASRLSGELPYELMTLLWGKEVTDYFAEMYMAEKKHEQEGRLIVAFQILDSLNRKDLLGGEYNKDGALRTYTLDADGKLRLNDVLTAGSVPVQIDFQRLTGNLYVCHVPNHPPPDEILFHAVVLND